MCLNGLPVAKAHGVVNICTTKLCLYVPEMCVGDNLTHQPHFFFLNHFPTHFLSLRHTHPFLPSFLQKYSQQFFVNLVIIQFSRTGWVGTAISLEEVI